MSLAPLNTANRRDWNAVIGGVRLGLALSRGLDSALVSPALCKSWVEVRGGVAIQYRELTSGLLRKLQPI
ncbi:MAG: hypothetical protein NVS2B16_16010 [Chloroflexota bacterium]